MRKHRPAKYGSREHHKRISTGLIRHHARNGSGSPRKWIQKSHLKKGGLHKALGIPLGKPIPPARLAQALRSPNPHVRHMAQFASNAKKFKHKKGVHRRHSMVRHK
jgi:hypothetical protein